jgi:hypothetical protein
MLTKRRMFGKPIIMGECDDQAGEENPYYIRRRKDDGRDKKVFSSYTTVRN